MKYTPEQIKQMAKYFINAVVYNDNRAQEIIRRLEQRGWPMEHSFANIKALAK